MFLARIRQTTVLVLPFLFLLAFAFANPTNAQTNLSVVGVTSANQLVRFNSSRPNVMLGTPVTITGLAAGENILGIDFRPANGRLYGLGSTSRLYIIDVATGAATAVGAAGAFTLSGTEFGFDFNPMVDLIRVVSNTGQNLRINPINGTLTATDTPLNPGVPQVTGAGYTNSFTGATTTTLYDIDSGIDALFIQNPPNAGTLVLVGLLGVDIGPVNGFDIGQGSNTALLAAQMTLATTSTLYSVNLTTGTATPIGPINSPAPIRGIAIAGGSAASTTVDFDGDGRTDYSVFRTSNRIWYINNSSSNTFSFTPFGRTGDIFTPGDYDGDGRDDISVWRSEGGVFFVLRSSTNTISGYQLGIPGDEPVARDYDGDGRTDYAVVRRTGGRMVWYINNSANNTFRIEQFGLEQDVTAPGDYDGDGRFDLAVYRTPVSGQGTFFVNGSMTGFRAQGFGLFGDLVVPGDYDGDGRTDFAVVRTGTQYRWFIQRSSDNGVFQVDLGTKPHFPTQGDYDGDGRTDISVWDPGLGAYYTYRSSNGALVFYRFGQNGDIPIASFDTH